MHALAAIQARRTAHQWKPCTLDSGIVDRCLEAAHQAPCHKHTWPWRFVQVGPLTREAILATALKLAADGKPLSDKKKAFIVGKVGNPGALIVVTQVMHADPARAREDYAACACAIQNLMVAAAAHDLHSKWATGKITKHPEITEHLKIQTDENVVGFIWLGVPKTVPTVTRPPVDTVTRRLP